MRKLAPALAALLLFTAACGDGGEDSTVGSGSGSGSATTAATGTATSDDVEVVDAGENPKRELRFDLKKGYVSRSAMTMRFGFDTTVDGQAVPIGKVPTIRLVMAATVDEVNGDEATMSVTYEDPKAMPEPGIDQAVIDQVNAGLVQLEGLKGTIVADNRGVVKRVSFDTASLTDPTVKSTVESIISQAEGLTVPLPSAAVGKGAVWTATREVTLNGITTDVVTKYTLTSVTDDAFEADVTQDLSADPGPVELPGLGDAKAEIVSYAVRTTGTMKATFASALPSVASMKGGGDIKMKISQGGQTADMLQKLTMEISFDPA